MGFGVSSKSVGEEGALLVEGEFQDTYLRYRIGNYLIIPRQRGGMWMVDGSHGISRGVPQLNVPA